MLDNKFSLLTEQIDKLLQEKTSVIIAVDGRSGSGKTTLGELIKEKYGSTVIHMDDFFLRPEQRTAERYCEVGGNIDYERFVEEVLIPLKKQENFNLRRFDCGVMKLTEPVFIKPDKMTVIEGVYSMHRLFRNFYDFSVFLDITPELQKTRIILRNSPQIAERFFNEWIPLEEKYFINENIREKCNLVIELTC